MVDQAGDHEKRVAQSIEVNQKRWRDVLAGMQAEGDNQPLGPSANGSCKVELRGGRGAAREDERGQPGELRLHAVNLPLERGDMIGGDRRLKSAVRIGVGEGRADDEQLVLNPRQERVDLGVERLAAHDAERGVELVNGAEGLDPQVVLSHTAAAEQAGGAVVAGLGVDGQGGVALKIELAPAIGVTTKQAYTMQAAPSGERPQDPSGTKRDGARFIMLRLLTLAVVLAAGPEEPAPAKVDAIESARMEARHLKNIRQVTFDFAKAGEGYFRPDGRAVIFQAAKPGEDDYQIYTLDLKDGAEPRLVSTGRGKCTCAYYHPDGQSILFASTHLDTAPKPADASKKGPAYSRTASYRWDFDPAMDIFRARLDGSDLVRLTDTPGYDAEGSYSPDGKQIIFTSFRDGDAEIYIMDADGKNPRRITSAKGYDGGPFFAPDGKKIIYRSDRKQNDMLQVYINTTEGNAERALTDNDAVNWGPFFYPDSRHIVYSTSLHGHQNYEIYLMDTETGRQERVTYREGFDALPVFSKDGKRLLWTSKGRTRNNTSQLFIADFELEVKPAESP